MLPYRLLLPDSVVDPYWPVDQGGLDWVCDRCRRFSVFAIEDLQMQTATAQPQDQRGFWRVEIACPKSDCSSAVIVHTQTYGRTSRKALGLRIAIAHPTPHCGLGHPVRIEQCYPLRVDFVEWSGPESHVV